MSNATPTDDTDFDYDIDESLGTFNWAELAPVLVVYSITFFIGLIGELRNIIMDIIVCY